MIFKIVFIIVNYFQKSRMRTTKLISLWRQVLESSAGYNQWFKMSALRCNNKISALWVKLMINKTKRFYSPTIQ